MMLPATLLIFPSAFFYCKLVPGMKNTEESLLEMPGIEDGLFFQTILHSHLFSD